MKKSHVKKLALARETVRQLAEPGLGQIVGGTLTLEGGPSCWPDCARTSGEPNCIWAFAEDAARDRMA